MTHVVVDNFLLGLRYVISDERFDPARHTYVRELSARESVRNFQVKQLAVSFPAIKYLHGRNNEHGTYCLEPSHES